jgi:cyclic pyranopterin phosphate synthase
MILEPNGSVGFCRHKGTKFSFGNIKQENIWDIWNGEKVRQWRREFLLGKPLICATEIEHRHCNLCPQLNKLLPHAQLSEVLPNRILRFTANFNGKCNLQCQMCDVWKMENGLYDDLNFWEPAEKEIFPYLKEVDLLSGEPFIQKDTYRLIDIVSRVNPNCDWTFTTNAHWKLTEFIQMKLNKISIKNIILSVDSFTPEIYHKIRYPGKLEFVLDNIDNLIHYNEERIKKSLSNLNMTLNFLVQKDNWHEVKNAIDYCESKKITPFITFLYEPSEFSLLGLGSEKREEILNFYIDNLDYSDLLRLHRVIKPLLSSLPTVLRAEYSLKFTSPYLS